MIPPAISNDVVEAPVPGRLTQGFTRHSLIVTCLLVAPWIARAESVLDSISAEVRSVYEKTKNSVVQVKAATTSGASQGASGFFIDSAGKLLTTASATSNAGRMWIDWQGAELPLQPVGVDPRANVALLQVAQKPENMQFPSLSFGDSKSLQVGSIVIAMGSAFGKAPSPSFGVIDGFDLPRGPRQCVATHIRADIPLNPGEGGGPLLNTRGEVIGLLVASVENSRTSFALPSHALRRLIADFEQYGEARYGWMGMSVRECKPEEHDAAGVRTCIKVQQVFSNTPAALVGIQANDQIVKLGDATVERLSDMLDTCLSTRVGERINVVVQRQSLLTNFLIEVVQRPSRMPGRTATPAAATR